MDNYNSKKHRNLNFDAIPPELRKLRCWVLWHYAVRDGKRTKVPVQPRRAHQEYEDATGSRWYRASITKTKSWSTFETVREFYEAFPEEFDGVGAIMCGGILGGDLDQCRDAETGEVAAWAREIVDEVGTYTEISPSGKGLRFFLAGSFARLKDAVGVECVGDLRNRKKFHGCVVEFYDVASPRFLTVTGDRLPDAPDALAGDQGGFNAVYSRVFAPEIAEAFETKSRRAKRRETLAPTAVSADESAILAAAFRAKNGHNIRLLWEGKWEDARNAAGAAYDSQSEADAALAHHLAFYVGPDPDRLFDLICSSGLYRPKWDRVGPKLCARATDRDEFYSWDDTDDTEERLEAVLDVPAAVPPPPAIPPRDVPDMSRYEAGDEPVKAVVKIDPTSVPLQGWDEVCDIADHQVEEWIIPKWLEFGTLALFTGLPFSGKSTITGELIAAIAQRRDFYGMDVTQVPIILLDLENKERILVKRIRTCLDGDEGDIRKVFFRVPPPSIQVPLEMSFIKLCLRELRDKIGSVGATKGLVVIDTFRSAFAGADGFDEVDPASMVKLLKPLKDLAAETGWAIMVLHHNAKHSNSYSGSTAIAGVADYLWNWKSNKETLTGELSVEGRDDYQKPLAFRYDTPTKRNVLVGTVDEVQKQLKANKQADKQDHQLHKFLGYLTTNPAEAKTKEELIEATELGEGTVRNRIKKCLAREFIDAIGGGKNRQPYRYKLSVKGGVWCSNIDELKGAR